MVNGMTWSDKYDFNIQINWMKYFNGFMPKKITSDESIVSFAMDYLKNMAKLLRRQRPRWVHLIWTYKHVPLVSVTHECG